MGCGLRPQGNDDSKGVEGAPSGRHTRHWKRWRPYETTSLSAPPMTVTSYCHLFFSTEETKSGEPPAARDAAGQP